MLKAVNLTKRLGHLEILKGINLHIEKQKIACIVGASGAGKTTLLQILGTLDRPDSGQIEINQTDVLGIRGNKLAKFRNDQIGFIFQFHQLMPEFTAVENVMIPALLGGRKKDISMEKSKKLLAFLGLSERFEHKPSQLSGGEQQRVAVARALINDPAIVFADEPSGNLDSRNAQELHELFFRLRDEFQQTFVIVTHNEKLAAIADKQFEIRDGVIS